MLDLNLLVLTGVFVGLHKLILHADHHCLLRKTEIYSIHVFLKVRHPADLTRPPKFERADPGLSSITDPGLKQSEV